MSNNDQTDDLGTKAEDEVPTTQPIFETRQMSTLTSQHVIIIITLQRDIEGIEVVIIIDGRWKTLRRSYVAMQTEINFWMKEKKKVFF